MGLGLGIALKHLLPGGLYLAGLALALRAVSGQVQWALMLLVFLLPLRNFIERVQEFPLGNQFVDILLVGIILGWFVYSASKSKSLFQRSPINVMAMVLIIY